MKTIFAFSDSNNMVIPPRYLAIMGESDFILFTGDGLLDVECSLFEYKYKLHAVKGNCDGLNAEEEEVVQVEDVKFLLTHGHRAHSPLDLIYRAKELNCDCVLYGHSHVFSDESEDGIRLINIGSLSRSPTGDVGYTYIVVNGKNIFAKFVNLA